MFTESNLLKGQSIVMGQEQAKLGELLVAQGLVTSAQVDEALGLQKVSKKKLGQILIEQGFMSDTALADVLALSFQLPRLNLSVVSPNDKLLNLFTHQLLEKHKVFPIELKGQTLTLATHDPLDMDALQELRYVSGYQIHLIVATLDEIQQLLNQSSESMQTMAALKDVRTQGAQEAPVVKLVNSIIALAIQAGASDVHFEPQRENLRVRFRVDGILHEHQNLSSDISRKVISRIKIIAGMDVAENRRPQDGRLSMSDGQQEYDIRISTLQNMHGENVVLRILNKKFIFRDLQSLGMEAAEIAVIERLVQRPYGMVLVTGPTGAGKTTTLYSILNLLNDISKNIITVEDPVEYELPGITQTSINPFTGYTFASAIRHIVRHDPNIIMVGEIRDVETAEIAIRSALTGHLVLSTLHTNSAAGAITRLLDMNIEPFLISSAVIGVVAQRLIRKLCPFCKTAHPVTEEFAQLCAQDSLKIHPKLLSNAKGCDKCFGFGYSGRTSIYEILSVDEEIRKMVLKKENEQAISQLAISRGMTTLRMSGLKQVAAQISSLEEVLRVTYTEGV